jgi:multiple sugar transport system ATP-binding protein
MTIAPATLVSGEGEHARLKLANGCEVDTKVARAGLPEGGLSIGVRPEAVRVVATDDATTTGKVELVERLGERTLIYARLSDGQAITAEDEGYSRVAINDEVGLKVDGASAYIFGADGVGYHAAQRAS